MWTLHHSARKFMKTMKFYSPPIPSGAQNYVSYSRLLGGFCCTRLDGYARGARPVGASKTKISRSNCRRQQAYCGKERELPAASQATRIEVSKAPPLYSRL